MARALELTEEAPGQVAEIGIGEIHSSLVTSRHVEAAERDMRSALRQLVLAERELRSRSSRSRDLAEQAEPIAEVLARPGSDGIRTSG